MHSVQTPQHSALFSQVQEWKIVPPTTYSLQPPSPSLIYGAVHLARLFGQCQILLFNVVNTHLNLKCEERDLYLTFSFIDNPIK